MALIYFISIYFYWLLAMAISPFNKKAALFVGGRRDLIARIKKEVVTDQPIIWFHCASVGEFEQARPLIELYKKTSPNYKLLLTFFSPSGYELRKNYEYVDWVFYLPMDTPRNARAFLEIVRPAKAIFIKYEFWYNYLRYLKKMGVSSYVISAIFRKNQHFFKWYGGFFRKMLFNYTKLFVQDNNSKKLLESIGVKSVEVCGDTRFDRVYEITKNPLSVPIVKQFAGSSLSFVVGSSWEPDEKLIMRSLQNDAVSEFKIVIAPHEIRETNINRLEALLRDYKVIRYTDILKSLSQIGVEKIDNPILENIELAKNDPAKQEKLLEVNHRIIESDILIIDTVGLLSSIYQYADFAYVGGGFGVGIHNILEVAAYGLPIVFGPNYHKFREARELIEAGSAFSVSDIEDYIKIISQLSQDDNFRLSAGNKAKEYVDNNTGATRRIFYSL